MKIEKYDLAIKDAEKSLELNKNDYKAAHRQIICYKSMGNYRKALECLEEAETIHKNTNYCDYKIKLLGKIGKLF